MAGKKRLYITIALTALVLLTAAAAVFMSHYTYYLQHYEDILQDSLRAEEMRQSNREAAYELIEDMVSRKAISAAEYAADEMAEKTVTRQGLSDLREELGSENEFFFVRKSTETGKKFTVLTDGENSLELSEEAIGQLCGSGCVFYENGMLYGASAARDGYIIAGCSLQDMLNLGVVINSAGVANLNEEIIHSDAEGYVTDGEASYMERPFSEILYDISEIPFAAGTEELKACSVEGIGRCFCVVRSNEEGTTAAFIPERSLIVRTLRSCMVPVGLLLFSGLIITVYVLRFLKSRDRKESAGRQSVLMGKFVVDGELLSHVLGLFFFSIVFMAAIVFYVQSMVSYSDETVEARSKLTAFSQTVTQSRENQRILTDAVDSNYAYIADLISRKFLNNPDLLTDAELDKIVNRDSDLRSITFYDNTGTVKFSTLRNEGYTQSRDENEGTASVWSVLDGVKQHTGALNRDENGNPDGYTICIQRQDRSGAVKINFRAEMYCRYYLTETEDNAILQTDMGDSIKIYVSRDNPQIMKFCNPGDDTVWTEENILSDEMMQGNYSGVRIIYGTRYYVNVLTEDQELFACATPLSYMNSTTGVRSFFTALMGYFFMILIFFGAVLKKKTEDEADEKESRNRGNAVFRPKSLSEQLMDTEFRRALAAIAGSIVILLMLFLVLDIWGDTPSIFEFLTGSQWSRGFNIFSFTSVLFIIGACTAASVFFQQCIRVLCMSLGSRGITIGRMARSTTRFLLLLIAVFLSLREMGMDLRVLLTGAGILGAALSLCAQSTVNDMLSGFLIVFENEFRIGDWISVNGFRGQVTEIGIRTTTIVCGNCRQIINNSKLTNVTVLDAASSGANVEVSIAYEEDADKVIDLLKRNVERYQEEIPEIQDGPYVKGVTDLGESGVTIGMYAAAEQRNVFRVEREMRRVTKKLFDENGIVIPFPQVQVHMDNKTELSDARTGDESSAEAGKKA